MRRACDREAEGQGGIAGDIAGPLLISPPDNDKETFMAPTLLFRLQDGKIRVLEETVESWKRDREGALLALDAEDLVAEGLACWEDVRRSWMRTRRLATLNRLWDLQEVGKTMLGLLDRCIHVLGNVAGSAEKVAHDTGHAIEGRENLAEAMREAADLRDRVAKTWPWDERPVLPLDRKMAEASRAAQARGEARDVADILAGLRAETSPRQE
jgi:hypothetical protein